MIRELPEDFRDYRSPWFDQKCDERQNDPVLIGQELQIEYVGAGDPRFGASNIEEAEKTVVDPVKQLIVEPLRGKLEYTESINGTLLTFKDPEPKHSYVIGVDPASGQSEKGKGARIRSRSGIVVLDSTNWPEEPEVVATFQSPQMDPGWLSRLTADLAMKYNGALVCPETNGPGPAVIVTLLGSGTGKPMYVHLYTQQRSAPDQQGRRFRFGWNNNNQTRPLMEQAIANSLLKTRVCDQRIIDELITFVWHVSGSEARGKADRGFTDDLVIAFGLALLAAERWNGERKDEETGKVLWDDLLDEYRRGERDFKSMVDVLMGSIQLTTGGSRR